MATQRSPTKGVQLSGRTLRAAAGPIRQPEIYIARRQPRPLLEKLVDDRVCQREHGHIGGRHNIGARAQVLDERHLAENIAGDEPRQNTAISPPHVSVAG